MLASEMASTNEPSGMVQEAVAEAVLTPSSSMEPFSESAASAPLTGSSRTL